MKIEVIKDERETPENVTGFYVYDQNNSGGNFVVDDSVSFYVVVEASSAPGADVIAASVGVYFDGCDSGRDCPCCGDRWSAKSGWTDSKPDYATYEDVVKDFESTADGRAWTNKDYWAAEGEVYAYVYFIDGTVIKFIK